MFESLTVATPTMGSSDKEHALSADDYRDYVDVNRRCDCTDSIGLRGVSRIKCADHRVAKTYAMI